MSETREPEFWAVGDSETLHEEPYAAMEAFLERFDDKADWPETVELRGYAPMRLSEL